MVQDMLIFYISGWNTYNQIIINNSTCECCFYIGCWFGTWILFFHILGTIIPTDYICFFFQKGLKPPTSICKLMYFQDVIHHCDNVVYDVCPFLFGGMSILCVSVALQFSYCFFRGGAMYETIYAILCELIERFNSFGHEECNCDPNILDFGWDCDICYLKVTVRDVL
jgi:hypothetical protein